jgi:hypothetical protein
LPARFVGGRLGQAPRLAEWSIRRWLFSVVIPAVIVGAEHLIDTDDKPIVVNALAAVDFEDLRATHRPTP